VNFDAVENGADRSKFAELLGAQRIAETAPLIFYSAKFQSVNTKWRRKA